MARRGGKNRGGGKKWSRKRKADERASKSDKSRNGSGPDGFYKTVVQSNPRFEAYYSRVGLHDVRYDDGDGKEGAAGAGGRFVPCETDAERSAERDRFMDALASILPASFRVDRSLDDATRRSVLGELDAFVGKEMEVEIELPRRSPASGAMRNILENGTDGGGEKDDGPGDGGEGKDEGGAGDGKDDSNREGGGDAASSSADATTNGPTVVKKTIAPARPIPFISSVDGDGVPTVLGYQLSVDRRTLRRNKSLEPLHAWLKVQTDCGHVTRQETVSMIPPVVLDAREGMSVLDMCAAPGSKTCQLLENVGGLGGGGGGDEDGAPEPTGYVVANDADPKRAYMLVHQLRRMNSPSVFVTSCDGQYFPILDGKADRGTEREGTFDRVLADVPCSGDGTIRKNPGIWRHWNQLGSLALHPLQLSIALRGARLAKVGGYVVYSTCSMNPMENESVVAELLRVAAGSLALEDPRGRMEGLIARPGWASWRVLREGKHRTRRAMKDWKKKNNPKMQARRKAWEEKRAVAEGHYGPSAKEARVDEDPKKEENNGDEKDQTGERTEEEEKFFPSPYDTLPYVPPATWDDATLSERTTSLGFVEYKSYDEVEPEWRRRVRASCFPPTKEEAESFELHKCLRCLPQDMDTGGFFVALLKKVKPLNMQAIERMNALAKESRGGFEVDTHLNKPNVDDKKKTNGKSKSEGNTIQEKDTPDTQLVNASEDKDGNNPQAQNKKEDVEEEPVRKAPQGKVGMYHKHQKKNDLSNEDFIPVDPAIWPPIVEEFGLASTFPKEQYMVRASGEAKVLYFISRSIKEELIDRGIQDRVTVINSGLKGFERCSLKEGKGTSYRLAQEGIQYLVPHATKRILNANKDDFYKCVKEGFIEFKVFSESFQERLEDLKPGSFIVTLEGYEKDVAKKMYLTMWRRTNKVLNCFVTKIEMEGILSKLRALGHVPPKEEEKEEDENKGEPKEKQSAVEDNMDTST